ncbi:MAG TPA: GTPase domain-containing protein [Armatimonadota bacterium]|nr:GTPase domain-containing protein [Armatimonadota bacterium]
MASINYATKEISCKLVYYGPGMCGKTSNLQYIHGQVAGDKRGELVSLATPGERTLYFDFLPVQIAHINDFQVKFALYTVPGQTYYNATRKLVLRGADGLVFVADSQWDLMQENVDSLQNLTENLAEYNTKLDDLPFILQYNKRDLPDVAPVWYLDYLLNQRGVPAIDAVAVEGRGVFETLSTLCRYVIRDLAHRFDAGSL